MIVQHITILILIWKSNLVVCCFSGCGGCCGEWWRVQVRRADLTVLDGCILVFIFIIIYYVRYTFRCIQYVTSISFLKAYVVSLYELWQASVTVYGARLVLML